MKWKEAETVSKMKEERVHHFYWHKIRCMFVILGVIILDNGTQFVSVVHPRENKQGEPRNKVILNGIKKKLDDA